MASGVFVTNLPYGISEAEFSEKLKHYFPEEFKVPIERGSAEVQVFDHEVDRYGKDVQKAMVWNVSVNVEELRRKASRTPIDGMKWAFHKDDGTQRSRTGERLVRLGAADVRARKRLEGVLVTKPLDILSGRFMEEINHHVFNAMSSLYVKSTTKVTPAFKELGLRVLNDTGVSEIGFGIRRVFFPTTLDALQTLTFLNGNGYIFCDNTGETVSTYAGGHGLGLEGEMLDFEAYAKNIGYVSFTDFYATMFNVEQLASFRSHCWKYQTKYELLGVDVNLTFVAGRCSHCIYDENLPIMDNNRGFFFGNEQFTRLFLAKSTHADEEAETNDSRWMIRFPAMKQFYKSAEEFRNHAGPLLQEEWNSEKEGFKEAYSTTGGVLSKFRVIEVLKEDPPKTHILFEATIPVTSFWAINNFGAIGHLTVLLKATKGARKISCNVQAAATLCTLREMPGKMLVVVAKMKISGDVELNLNSEITIVPHPIKTKYQRAKYAMNKWVESPSNFPFLLTFLNPNCSIKLPETFSNKKDQPTIYTSELSRLQRKLNTKQHEALQTCKISAFLILQGPAGTGKTYTASAIIANTLGRTEKGHTLSVTPSNFACDHLAASVAKVGYNLNIRVLRIFARSLEKQFRSTGEKIDLGPNVIILHEAVRTHPKYLADDTDVMNSIRQKFNSYAEAEFMLTEKEEDYFDRHIKLIETDIMKKCQVFVCTTDCTGDGRLLSYPGTISTLLIDEGGQLSQTHTIPLAAMKIRRLIISGDDQQLRAFVKSYSADLSGFGWSIMDWYRINGSSVPWITLEVQYRMSSNICAVASELSYSGKLINDPSVLDMPANFTAAFGRAFNPKLQSTVLLFDHDFKEERVKGSFSIRNPGEMKFIGSLCQRLVQCGISPDQLTVLALYVAQKKAIEQYMSKSKIAVHSVDSFQGRQQEVVILSMTRGGKSGIGFASRKPRLTVAVTRARKLLIVVCNKTTFSKHKGGAIQNFLQLIQKHGDIRRVEDFK